MSKSLSFHLPRAAALLLVLFLAFMVSPGDRTEEPSDRPARHSSHQTSPALTARHFTAADETETVVRAREALRILVQTHPDERVRENLNRLIVTRTVLINLDENTLRNTPDVAAIIALPVDGHLHLILCVSPSALLGSEYATEDRQMIILHETIHAQQVLEGGLPIEALAPAELEHEDEAYLTRHVVSEVEAYAQECEFARRINATERLSLCVAYEQDGMPGLRRAFISILLEQQYASFPAQRAILERLERESG